MAKTAKKAAPKKAAKKVATKTAAKPAAPKPIKEALSKSALVAHIVEASGVVAKDVRAVMASLEHAVAGSVSKKGAGSFTLPGLLKITAVSVPAKPKRKGINPFTKEEQWFAAKPATTKLKVRPKRSSRTPRSEQRRLIQASTPDETACAVSFFFARSPPPAAGLTAR